MRKLFSIIVSTLTLSLFTFNAFAEDNVKKLSNFKKTGTERGVVIEQDTK